MSYIIVQIERTLYNKLLTTCNCLIEERIFSSGRILLEWKWQYGIAKDIEKEKERKSRSWDTIKYK